MTTGEGNDVEARINFEKPYDVPKPQSRLQRLRDKWYARKHGKQITVHPQILTNEADSAPVNTDPEVPIELHEPQSEPVQAQEEIIHQIKLYPDKQEELIRRYADLNQFAAGVFVSAVRANYKTLIGETGRDYSNPAVLFNSIDLMKLCDRWGLPALIVYNSARVHFMLALNMPEMIDGRWQVLVYDPLNDQSGRTEYYYPLDPRDNWDPKDTSRPLRYQLTQNGLNYNNLTVDVISAEEYDLRLYGDEEAAIAVSEAKRVRTQFNASDCGPLSVFAAAIRTAYREGNNAFKSIGRETLEADTGVTIRTREEILAEARQAT